MSTIKKGAKAIGEPAIDSLTNIAKDAIKDKNIKETSKENLESAINTLKIRGENHLRGEGRKKIRKFYSKRKIISE